jgi:hypothetical protein
MKIKKSLRTLALISVALLALVLGACRGLGAAPEPTLDLSLLYTQVAGTLAAEGQGGGEPGEATAAPAQTTESTPADTSTPVATATSTPIPATNTPVVLCYQAGFIADITIPDGTKLAAEKDFTKTWRLRNTGTCSWDTDFDIVFVSGTNLAANKSYDIPEKVNPGETVDISIKMESPAKDGNYTSSWMIRTDDGKTFGVGNGAAVAFFAQITVGKGGGSSNGYDFAANFCDADWESDTGDLPCPGSVGGTKGFVVKLNNPKLENKTEDEPAIWMRPNHHVDGFVRGVFPNYTVGNSDHFIAVIGCHGNSDDCRVQFTLSYINSNGVEKQLGTWDEKFDNLTKTIDVDLSSLAGKKVKFVLTVEPNNNQFGEADALWFDPHIEP